MPTAENDDGSTSTSSSTNTSSSRDSSLLQSYLESHNKSSNNMNGSINTTTDNNNNSQQQVNGTSSSNNNQQLMNGASSFDVSQEGTIPPIPEPDSLARILSGCSIASTSCDNASCPICLYPMTPIDHEHPLQCPTRHCHYNFCASCIHSLLSSSKDDFEMASDGNNHVKVYLNCPNCRADLASSIRDVLLLRKIDTVEFLLSQRRTPPRVASSNSRSSSSSRVLNASQERTRAAMEEWHVQEAVARARASEKEFWKTHHRDLMAVDDNDDGSKRRMSRLESSWKRRESSSGGCSTIQTNNSCNDEEWGVEADLVNGVHSSFRLPADQKMTLSPSAAGSSSNKNNSSSSGNQAMANNNSSSGSNNSSTKKPVIDETLLHGLESCMTHAEQLNISHLLTTGDPDDLAAAAHILQTIEQDARQGIQPAQRQQKMNRRASVFGIVEETRQIHQGDKPASKFSLMVQQQQQQHEQHQRQRPAVAPYMTHQKQQQLKKAAERRQFELTMMVRASIIERCPLPVRMPKSITLDLSDPLSRGFPLRFCDDTWDGTILDAYTRLNIAAAGRNSSQKWKITKKAQTQHPGVFHVLSEGQYENHYGDVMLASYSTDRILVASVQGHAGRQGVMKGDVVTHVDGKALTVGTTVEGLIAILESKQAAGHSTFEMVLNAEPSIAEALKRRASVMP